MLTELRVASASIRSYDMVLGCFQGLGVVIQRAIELSPLEGFVPLGLAAEISATHIGDSSLEAFGLIH